jgi:tRNA A37 threonylcarbamoyladenosine modification protein TsaB
MYLILDPSEEQQTRLVWSTNGELWQETSWSTTRSRNVLVGLEQFLNEKDCLLSAIKGLAIVVGKGRFTATRVAVIIANVLRFSLQIPVISLKEIPKNTGDIHAVFDSDSASYIHPRYSGLPHLGGSNQLQK